MKQFLFVLFVTACLAVQASAGTQHMVKDINVGVDASKPTHIITGDRKIYFRADDAETGKELWVSDGTHLGTRLVADIAEGQNSSSPIPRTAFGEKLLFTTKVPPSVWVTSGDGPSTIELMTLNDRFRDAVSLGDRAYFVIGIDMWVTDGSVAGTIKIENFSADYSEIDGGPTVFQDAIIVAGSGKLWRLDPNELIPHELILEPDTEPKLFHAASEHLYIITNDPVRRHSLFWSDGTSAGTHFIKDISEGHSFNTWFIGSIEDRVIFLANDGDVTGYEPWISDGTAEGTTLLFDVNPGSGGSFAWDGIELDGQLFFRSYDVEHGTELWVTDGTTAGTRITKDVFPGPEGGLHELTKADGKLIFSADDGVHGAEIWTSDGTESGTNMISDIIAGPIGSEPTYLTALDREIFFSAYHERFGVELWSMSTAHVNNESTEPGDAYDAESMNLSAYPNPSSSTTRISFTLPSPSLVSIEVFDVLGKRVRVLVREIKAAGEHEVTFDTANLPSGIYFYTLTAGGFSQTKRIVILK